MSNVRESLEEVFAAALRAVDPARAVREAVQCDGDLIYVAGRELPPDAGLVVFAVGKAAGTMASALEEVVGSRIARGLVVVPDGLGVEFVTAAGKTQALLTLAVDDVRSVIDTDLIAVRRLDKSA